jgi:hypothetical protein
VKFTQYFLFMRQRSDRASIKLEWIQHVIDHPERKWSRPMGGFAVGPPFQKQRVSICE